MCARMKQFLSTLPLNLIGCFKGWRLGWHAMAILLTFVLVASGGDWLYFRSTRCAILWAWMIPSAPIGFLAPVALPFLLLAVGSLCRSATTSTAGWAVGQAEILGTVIAAGYKSLTGRVHPSHSVGPDLSHLFRFGFLRGGTFWGWPSSHTTIAFATAATLFTLFPKHRWLGWGAFAYALYIGIGVSTTIHWLSDFVAGAIIGTAIGAVVGRSFLGARP
jgi:membrane-associated phospholipid phosphatase